MGQERNPFTFQPEATTATTGTKRYGAGRTSAATAGALPPDGYELRKRNAAARRAAIARRVALADAPGSIDPMQMQHGGY